MMMKDYYYYYLFWFLKYFFIFIGLFCVVVLYFFNSKMLGCDVGLRKNMFVCIIGVCLVFGFDGFFRGLFYFIGWCGSYVFFLNNGGIDIRNFIIILVWVKFEKGGLVFYYNL